MYECNFFICFIFIDMRRVIYNINQKLEGIHENNFLIFSKTALVIELTKCRYILKRVIRHGLIYIVEKFRKFRNLTRTIQVQTVLATVTQDNMRKLFEYGGRISALAEGDRVDAFVEVPRLWFFAAVTCITCLRGYVDGGRGGGSLG